MISKFLVYALTDPRDGTVRYIGKSSSGLQRAQHHATPQKLKKDKTYKGNWIRSLLSLGLRPSIEVVEELPIRDLLADTERFWIAQFRAWGFRLTNLTSGGDGCASFRTESHKRKISAAHKGKKLSSETIEKIRLTAQNRAPEHYIKAVAARRAAGGLSHSEETKQKISASVKAHRARIKRKPV